MAAHGEPLLVPDAARDARFYGAPDKTLNHRTRSILCVPLRGQGKLLGVLEAINSKSPGGFTPDARTEALRAGGRINLMDRDEFIELMLEHYEKLEPRFQAAVPLVKLWLPAR